MSRVEVKNVSKIYNQGSGNEVNALQDATFSLESGEFVVILGPSGAGKSTLLNILGGMDKQTSGQFIVDGLDVSSLKDKELGFYRKNKVGFVFQFYNLLPNLTAIENVQIGEALVEESLSSVEVLNSVGLSNRINNFPSELSGGEQQRVAIARALVKNPSLLLCDEPTGALDSKTGTQIIELLLEVCKKYNKTTIIVTHNTKIADVANRVIKVQDGKIISNIVNKKPLNPKDIVW